MCVCLCVCVRACVRAYVRACVCVCVCGQGLCFAYDLILMRGEWSLWAKRFLRGKNLNNAFHINAFKSKPIPKQSQFNSVQFQEVSMPSEMPICAPTHLSEISPALPSKQFQCSSEWKWPSLVLPMLMVVRFHFPRLSSPGERGCDVLGFVSAGIVSSFSTFQIFVDASHL